MSDRRHSSSLSTWEKCWRVYCFSTSFHLAHSGTPFFSSTPLPSLLLSIRVSERRCERKRDKRGKIKKGGGLATSGPNCSHGSHWGLQAFQEKENETWTHSQKNFCLSFSFFLLYFLLRRQAIEIRERITCLWTAVLKQQWKGSTHVKLKKIKPRGVGEGIEKDIVWKDVSELELGGGLVFTRHNNSPSEPPRRDARKASFLIKRN
jgi:hypothetical protein